MQNNHDSSPSRRLGGLLDFCTPIDRLSSRVKQLFVNNGSSKNAGELGGNDHGKQDMTSLRVKLVIGSEAT